MASPLIQEVKDAISVPVLNRQGETVETLSIDPVEFGGKISPRLMHEAVLQFLANQRAGTHSTLRRGEVAGSTKKLFRQKGTGNARVGNKRTNKRRGGGTSKGPKPRDYEYHMPKKAVRSATRMAILSKFRDGEAIVVDDLAMAGPKTKEFAALLKALNVTGKTVLVGTVEGDQNVYKSARNIEGVRVLPAGEFNTYMVLRQKRLVLSKAAFELLREKSKTQLSGIKTFREQTQTAEQAKAGK